jgi:hypothetical protein
MGSGRWDEGTRGRACACACAGQGRTAKRAQGIPMGNGRKGGSELHPPRGSILKERPIIERCACVCWRTRPSSILNERSIVERARVCVRVRANDLPGFAMLTRYFRACFAPASVARMVEDATTMMMRAGTHSPCGGPRRPPAAP